jgi:hypothetical protein
MFRNIVLPRQESVNILEQNATRKVADSGYFKNIEVGAGSKTFKMDERGIWMGSSDFDTAPFRVDMEGNIIVTATNITQDISFKYYDVNGNLAIKLGFNS